MSLHIALVAEILATFLCIHCIYGKKFKPDVNTAGAILGILIILEIINIYQIDGNLLLLVYVILFVYCKTEFKSLFIEAIISLVLCMIISTSLQFVCFSLVNIVIYQEEYFRNAIGNVFVLAICVAVLPRCGLHKLQEGLCKKRKYIVSLSGFICLVVIIMLLQEKINYEIQIQYFALAVPLIFILLYLFAKWYAAQNKADRMEAEVYNAEKSTKEYENLLTKVRLQQHEFKNHITAVFSAHYTHKTYEKLVQAQEEYCRKLLHENKYNNLLLLGNNILVGFLYEKFREAEADGIELNYKVAAMPDKLQVSTYYIIEMLGILFDNAVEALKNSTEKRIIFEALELDDGYEFSIKNPSRYVSYEEISEWFELGKSEKGSGRGLGLYHLKCLCDEWKCDVGCRNMEINQGNWIVFTLKIGKADNG